MARKRYATSATVAVAYSRSKQARGAFVCFNSPPQSVFSTVSAFDLRGKEVTTTERSRLVWHNKNTGSYAECVTHSPARPSACVPHEAHRSNPRLSSLYRGITGQNNTPQHHNNSTVPAHHRHYVHRVVPASAQPWTQKPPQPAGYSGSPLSYPASPAALP